MNKIGHIRVLIDVDKKEDYLKKKHTCRFYCKGFTKRKGTLWCERSSTCRRRCRGLPALTRRCHNTISSNKTGNALLTYTEVRSCRHCCSGKAVSMIYSVCVCVRVRVCMCVFVCSLNP